jgi:uncharacterized protein YndB with AHSA1/START domain
VGSDLTTGHSIAIDRPAQAVWDALTTPEVIRQWFFGVETVTDWAEGSPIVHTGTWQDRPYEDRGTIVRFEPPTLLVHTHWSPMSGLPDLPEHYQEVSWTLADSDGRTVVTVSETNLPSDEAKAVSDRTWPVVLENLRQVLEGS